MTPTMRRKKGDLALCAAALTQKIMRERQSSAADIEETARIPLVDGRAARRPRRLRIQTHRPPKPLCPSSTAG